MFEKRAVNNILCPQVLYAFSTGSNFSSPVTVSTC